ncbi:NUDIX domain-containing protein [Sphingobium sp. D43FB]|uniref:NUDIX domain-containing protein n=1 Tax=Sphingobium sp. D43FB TaxID=2017595 RepID=UPI000BB555DE|nr:NUDIX domain-containing protein [Sphingobium sp. D43FB]PBN43887.1 NUDIX hydrolase [Sphingobium sp. D43FB]
MTDMEDRSRPAATVVIVRDRADGPPDILMMERASTMAFAAGALVFPGGAVDADDHDLAARIDHGLEQDEAAARIAAIRETIEEAGLGVGLHGVVDAATVLRLRDGLREGVGLGALLDRHRLEVAFDALTPFARWHPAPFDQATRIFDTRFYIARAPDGQMATVDTTENVKLFWSGATATLAQCDAGEGKVIYPTRRNLERLALCANHAELVAHARAYPVEKVRPWQEERDGERHLCIPDHLGYPITSEPMGQVRRA